MCRARIVNLVDENDVPRENPEVKDLQYSTSTVDGVTPDTYNTPEESFAYVPCVSGPAAHPRKPVQPREMKSWNLIPLPEGDWFALKHFAPGFQVSVYDATLTNYFQVPSENVIPTHGAIRYIEHYNEFGPYSRFRFQLCNNFQRGRCQNGAACTYIHAAAAPETAQKIHMNNGTVYDTLPAGVVFPLFCRGHQRPQLIPSEYILVTKGAVDVYHAIIEGNPSNIQRPQHCAHFQFKKMCNRGADCGFIHSLVPQK